MSGEFETALIDGAGQTRLGRASPPGSLVGLGFHLLTKQSSDVACRPSGQRFDCLLKFVVGVENSIIFFQIFLDVHLNRVGKKPTLVHRLLQLEQRAVSPVGIFQHGILHQTGRVGFEVPVRIELFQGQKLFLDLLGVTQSIGCLKIDQRFFPGFSDSGQDSFVFVVLLHRRSRDVGGQVRAFHHGLKGDFTQF